MFGNQTPACPEPQLLEPTVPQLSHVPYTISRCASSEKMERMYVHGIGKYGSHRTKERLAGKVCEERICAAKDTRVEVGVPGHAAKRCFKNFACHAGGLRVLFLRQRSTGRELDCEGCCPVACAIEVPKWGSGDAYTASDPSCNY